MREGVVFDADLHNKRLKVHTLFGTGATKVRPVEQTPAAKSAAAPVLNTWTLELPKLDILGPKTVLPAHDTRLLTRVSVLHGTLYAAHAVVFLALLVRSRPSFAVLVHAAALTLGPALALSVADAAKRAAALLVHLAGVVSLLHQSPALDAELLSPAFYALFVLLLLARISNKALSATACASRMCVVFYVLHATALLAIVALFAVREAVTHDSRDQGALDLTATATAGIVLASHVLF
jgi:hypothetical protein